MNSPTTPNQPKQHPLFVPRIVWGALLFSSFMYQTIVTMRPAPESPPTHLLVPFGIAAAVIFVMSFVLPPIVGRSKGKTLPRDAALEQIVKVAFTPFILRMALADSICILGVSAAVLLGANNYYAFWATGVLSMLLAFPSEASFRKLIGRDGLTPSHGPSGPIN